MGINKRFIKKFDEAYKDIPETIIPIDFLPTSPYYHQEEWREVLPMFVPNVLPNTYWISNMGRVYTKLKSPIYPNGGIMIHSINSKGYHQINLQGIDKKKIGIKITKLVMLHFRFIPNCHYLEVDHIDGNKDNNCLWNLEWVDPQENTHRAIKNHQRNISVNAGEYNGILLSNNDAKTLYQEALNSNLNQLNYLSQEYNVSLNYIKGLLNGAIRPYIRYQYINNISCNST